MDLSYNSNRSLQCIEAFLLLESVTDDQLCSNIVFNIFTSNILISQELQLEVILNDCAVFFIKYLRTNHFSKTGRKCGIIGC